MSDETKCPKCGARPVPGTRASFVCGTWMQASGFAKQSDDCGRRENISQLEQQLSVAVAALGDVSKCIGTPELIAAEALKQIGATDER